MHLLPLLLVVGAALAAPDGTGGHHGHHGHHGEHHAEHHGAGHDAGHGAHHVAAPQKVAAVPQRPVAHHAAHHPAPQHHAPQHHQPRPAPHRAPARPLPPRRPAPQRAPFRGQRPVPVHQRPVPRRRPVQRGPPRHHNNPFLVPGNPRPERAPRFPPQKPGRQPIANVPQAVPVKSSKPLVPTGKSLAQALKENEHFSTLYTALKAADLITTLEKSNTDYTIFAPTNAAFDKVPVDTLNGLLGDKEALRKVLLRHVIPGRKLEGKDVPTGSTKMKTASGEEVKADRGKFVQVSSSNKKAFVVKFDFVGSNGVSHAIDQVL